MDESTGYYYYGARYYDPGASIFLSVDPLAEQFPGWTPYHYVHNNPINLIDPTGMSAQDPGEDIMVNKDNKGNVTGVERVYTGEDTANRLFVQDPNATSETPNRYNKDGNYYEQRMIPSSEYTEEDYKPLNGNPMNTSQIDKDRNDYIYKSGVNYTDSKWNERLGESLMDDPVTVDDLKTILTRSRNGGSVGSNNMGAMKGERGFTGKASGTNNPFKHIKVDPNKPGNVIYKHPQSGKKVSRPATADEKSHFGF